MEDKYYFYKGLQGHCASCFKGEKNLREQLCTQIEATLDLITKLKKKELIWQEDKLVPYKGE